MTIAVDLGRKATKQTNKAVVLMVLVHFLNVPPIGLWGLRVWSLFCYALMKQMKQNNMA